MSSEFGNKIKELRLLKGLKQQEIADILNVHKTTISSWELGKQEPNIDNIKILAKIFNISTDYLFGIENEEGIKFYNSYPDKLDKRELIESINKLTIKEEDKVKGYIDALLANRIN